MNKNRVWWIVGAIAVLIIACAAYLFFNSSRPTQPQQQSQTQSDILVPPTQATTEQPGTYQDYSEQALAESTAKNKLLFFYAPWCPQCHMLEKSIEQNGVPAGVAIFKVRYDDEQELKQKYGVTIQTTVVQVDDNGNLIKKHVAYLHPNLPATLEAFELK